MRRILLLDDETNVLMALRRSLRQLYSSSEMTVETFDDPKSAILRFGQVSFDFVIADYHMPTMNGVDFLRIVKEIQPNTVRMMLSASADFRTIMGAINEAEVFRYIQKPWIQEELKETLALASTQIDRITEDQKLANELRAQRNPLTPQEIEAQRLEAVEPGITKVNWGPDGSVRIE